MDIDLLIKKATFDKNNAAKEAYRAIKAELLLNNSSKNPKPEGKIVKCMTFDEFQIKISELDLAIIRKQIQIKEEQISMYEANNKTELANEYKVQLKYFKELIPEEISKDRIEEFVVTNYPNGFTQKEIGKIIKSVKETFISADGKIIAEIVKQHIV